MPSVTHRSRFRWTGAPPRTVAGLISGTSADGISAVIVRIAEKRGAFDVRQLAHVTRPYPPGMRQEIIAMSAPGAGTVDGICRMHAALGIHFAEALKTAARRARMRMASIDLIGSHGQTIHHLPAPAMVHGVAVRSTLQIGDPSYIAQITGIPTVGDFRVADMAVGGQGAPLVPLLDYLLFRSLKSNRLLLNLGGIANFTSIPARAQSHEIMAFDTGPGNMVIDALAQRYFGLPFDRSGRYASRGNVHVRLLNWMLSHPYFRAVPPKSTGREMFGPTFIDEMISRFPDVRPEDRIATATELTAISVCEQYARFIRRHMAADEVLVSGGGVHNNLLMQRLRFHFGSISVVPTSAAGLAADAKEAILFAVLAYFAALGRPGNVPHVSGAERPVILGKFCIP